MSGQTTIVPGFAGYIEVDRLRDTDQRVVVVCTDFNHCCLRSVFESGGSAVFLIRLSGQCHAEACDHVAAF